jgi:hypothetical protein
MDMGTLVHIVIVLIVGAMIAGILWWLVGSAPFIADPAKSFIQWVILALCALLVIYLILMPLIGGTGGTTIIRRNP